MRNGQKFILVLGMLLASCTSSSSTPPEAVVPVGETATRPSASQEVAESNTPLPSPTQVLPTLTQVPPTPTLPPVSKVVGPDNFTNVSLLQPYLLSIDELVIEQYSVEKLSWRISMWTYSPDGKYLAVGGCTDLSTANCYSEYAAGHAFLYILDAHSAGLIYSLPEEEIEVTGLSFSPDGKTLAYAVCPQQLRLFNIETLQTERTLWSSRGCGSHPKTAISPDGKQVAVVVDTRLMVFDLATGKQLTEQPAQRHGSVLPKYNQDGTRLAVFGATDGREIFIYDTNSWQRITRIQVSSAQVSPQGVDFSADGLWVATVDSSETADIQLWDATTGQRIATLEEPLQWLASLAFTPGNSLLLAGGTSLENNDPTVIAVWDPISLQRLGVISGLESPGRIMFANDGESFVASEFFSMSRWSLPDSNMLAARQAVTDLFAALAQGDFQAASDLYMPNAYEQEYLHAQGFDPTDLAAMLQTVCNSGAAPCIPLQEIAFSGREATEEESYLFILRFRAPDGSIFQAKNGDEIFWVYVGQGTDSKFRVLSLPYFFYGAE